MELRMPELPEARVPDGEDASAKDYVEEILEEQGICVKSQTACGNAHWLKPRERKKQDDEDQRA